MKKIVLLFLISISTCFSNSGIYINEIMASNKDIIEDESGKSEDWIEIYNSNSFSVDLKGYHLSDSEKDQKKWTFMLNTVIQPKGHLLVWCDGQPEEGALHTNFKLSKDGEFLGLYSPGAMTVIDTVTFYAQQEDISYGRYPDGSNNWIFFDKPTPRRANDPTSVPYIIDHSSKLYPNPAVNQVRIQSDVIFNEIIILDDNGKSITVNADFSGNEYTIDISSITSGNYQIIAKNSKEYFLYRFIKIE